jgi:hypothetical protein
VNFERPVEKNGAVFHGVGDVRLAFFNNLLRDGGGGKGGGNSDNGVWNAIDILVEGGVDPDEAECMVGDWNGGVL